MKRTFISFALVSFFLLPGLSQDVETELRIRIENINSSNAQTAGERIYCKKAISQFYQSQGFSLVWDYDLASEVINMVEASKNEGLIPSDYHYEALVKLFEKSELSSFEEAEYELLLTDAFILLTSHLMSGKVNPQVIDSEWKILRTEGDPLAVLGEAIDSRKVRGTVENVKPSFKHYGRLKERLLSYKKITREGGWSTIPAGETVKLGMQDSRVDLIAKRLILVGDLGPEYASDQNTFDEAIQESIKRFQKRHGLDIDGNVGKETLASLNVPVEARIEQIEINLERSRWLPKDLGSDYIMVNLPAFELEVIKDGQLEVEMEVAVGKPFRQTPVFSSKLSYLVFNPYWTVPPTILSQDIIPAQARNPNYLKNINIKVLDGNGTEVSPGSIDWSNVDAKNFRYTLRQEPGPNNALGVVKFIFPNPYNVYMHDTNHRELFSRADRALSSGCIRLSNPMDMASYLLSYESDWDGERINDILNSKQNYSVFLKNPWNVYMQYWTAFVSEDGQLSFRKDIYERDQKVLKALKSKPPQT